MAIYRVNPNLLPNGQYYVSHMLYIYCSKNMVILNTAAATKTYQLKTSNEVFSFLLFSHILFLILKAWRKTQEKTRTVWHKLSIVIINLFNIMSEICPVQCGCRHNKYIIWLGSDWKAFNGKKANIFYFNKWSSWISKLF